MCAGAFSGWVAISSGFKVASRQVPPVELSRLCAGARRRAGQSRSKDGQKAIPMDQSRSEKTNQTQRQQFVPPIPS
jgi:hypothetical protein